METIISRIKRKISAVQRKATEGSIEYFATKSGEGSAYRTEAGSLHVFGANKHRWKLSPPLGNADVTQWEQEMGVSLPEEYRRFVTEVGHCGMGPYYGLTDLHAAQTNSYRGDTQKTWMRRFYQAPCVYREGIEGEGDEWLVEAAGADWESRYDAETFDPQQGTLTLCEQGCAYETVMVLNGAYRGRIVDVYCTDAPRFTSHGGFFAWYETWLDAALAGRISW